MAANGSNEVKVTVTLVLNATFSWLEKPADSLTATGVVSCVCLGLLASTAILLNLCVVASVGFSNSLKKLTLNRLVAQMSLACLFDCFVNVPFSWHFMKTNFLGTSFCASSAASVIFFSLLIAWILCFMGTERFFSSMKRCPSARRSVVCKQRVVSGTVLVFVSCLTLPVLARKVDVRPFPSRYSCFVSSDKEVSYRIILTISLCIPVVLSMLTLTCAFVKNLQGIRNLSSQRVELSYTELFFEESHLWNEWQTSKFIGVVMLMFMFLELPVIVIFMKPTGIYEESLNSTHEAALSAPQITSSLEKAYFWGKYMFCLAFPLATLMLRKDIGKKIGVMLSYFRSSSSLPMRTFESPEESPDDFLVPQAWRRRRLSSVTCLKSPIVFGKSRSGSIQLIDLTTGIAKWKAIYDDSRSSKAIDRPFFTEIVDDDDEEDVVEIVNFQDLTDEELNSSDVPCVPSWSKAKSDPTWDNDAGDPERIKNTCDPTWSQNTCDITWRKDNCDLTQRQESGDPWSKDTCDPSWSKDISDHAHRKDTIASWSRNEVNSTSSKDVAIQTTRTELSESKLIKRASDNNVIQLGRRQRNCRLTKSFNCSRGKCANNYRYYMTFPKMSANQRSRIDSEEYCPSSDLMRVLQVKRSNRTNLTVCNLIPSGPDALLESPMESRDIVSL